jgi:hypothetical protein
MIHDGSRGAKEQLMAARYILSALAVLFLLAGLWRASSDGFTLGPAARTWLIIAITFGAVSIWLWFNGSAGAG